MDLSAQQMENLRKMMRQLQGGGLLGDGVTGPQSVEDERGADEILDVAATADEPANGFVVEEDTTDPNAERTMGFGGHYGGAPTERYATQEERYNPNNPPGGDYDRWFWNPTLGWQYRGSESDGTRGYSSYFNEAGQRAHYESPQQMQRDARWWDPKRATIGLREVWEQGGDMLLNEGARYNAETNPFAYTADMQREAENTYSPANQGVYDPVTNTTMFGGMAYQGDITGGRELSSYSEEDQQWLTNDQYYTGHGQFTPEGMLALRNAGGRGDPFINTFEQDVDRQLQYLGDAGWNPFYGDRGRLHQDVLDGQRAAGVIGEDLTPYERRSEGNAMDYMYKVMSSPDQIKNRRTLRNNWESLLNQTGMTADNFYNTRMSEGLFNRLGMNEMGLEYDREMFGPLPTNPLGGVEVKSGGFLDSYLKAREESKSKPSVMSLIDEMKDY